MRISISPKHLLPARFYGAFLSFLTGLAVFALTRVGLLLYSGSEPSYAPWDLLGVFATGLLFDVIVELFLLAPLVLFLVFVSRRAFARRGTRIFLCAWLCALNFVYFFTAVAEFFFWEEFASRFNFIAVDYLAYTTEVLGNIWQSYPIVSLVLGILALALWLLWGQLRCPLARAWFASDTPCRPRLAFLAAHAGAILLATLFVNYQTHPAFHGNLYNQELSLNGVYTLAAAFLHNQIDYEQFYSTMPEEKMSGILREELGRDGSVFLSDAPMDIRRVVTFPDGAQPHDWNVILVLEESFSAYFTGVLESEGRALTPNFDRLSRDGMLLRRCFASGTRTVRGIEAVQLSIPPTPGQSLVKRTNYEDMFSMGRLFRERGYRNTFLYGGNGFFDNMNAFFSANGYEIQDSTSPLSKPKTFSNAWGCCDEDLFQWSLDAADRAYADGVPFHQFVLTTSNHRPYTFPEGRIDAPQKSRSSAVRYSDYALGKFLEDASKKPWFANTLFVVVADHCHSTSGREALPLNKYHIPALFYNPLLIPAQKIDTVCSQIDIAPTLFGLLNWSYVSEFYGFDVARESEENGRAFPGTFQHLGFLNGETGDLTTLYPQRKHDSVHWRLQTPYEITGQGSREQDRVDLDRAIAVYQSASVRAAKRLDKVFGAMPLMKVLEVSK
jgi:phosphoglycerol transferase MdoB-like AlkP superfamily enzyme